VHVVSTGSTAGLGVYADSGLFLCFEGGDGGGKSTQAGLLRDWLVGRGHEVLLTFEPGDTDVGRDIRRIVLDSTPRPATSPTAPRPCSTPPTRPSTSRRWCDRRWSVARS
jgi:hypothetical protein